MAKNVTRITKEEIKLIIKEGIKESLAAELMKMRALLLPFVSDREQKEIERLYQKPSRKFGKKIEIEI